MIENVYIWFQDKQVRLRARDSYGGQEDQDLDFSKNKLKVLKDKKKPPAFYRRRPRSYTLSTFSRRGCPQHQILERLMHQKKELLLLEHRPEKHLSQPRNILLIVLEPAFQLVQKSQYYQK